MYRYTAEDRSKSCNKICANYAINSRKELANSKTGAVSMPECVLFWQRRKGNRKRGRINISSHLKTSGKAYEEPFNDDEDYAEA